MEVKQFGQYNGIDAGGWHVVQGDESIAGPYLDARIAHRQMLKIKLAQKKEAAA